MSHKYKTIQHLSMATQGWPGRTGQLPHHTICKPFPVVLSTRPAAAGKRGVNDFCDTEKRGNRPGHCVGLPRKEKHQVKVLRAIRLALKAGKRTMACIHGLEQQECPPHYATALSDVPCISLFSGRHCCFFIFFWKKGGLFEKFFVDGIIVLYYNFLYIGKVLLMQPH